MPHYFLDLERGPECLMDIVGCHAADDQTILDALAEVHAEFDGISNLRASGRNTWVMSIKDQSGRIVAKIPI